jgi:hypothetical protein
MPRHYNLYSEPFSIRAMAIMIFAMMEGARARTFVLNVLPKVFGRYPRKRGRLELVYICDLEWS